MIVSKWNHASDCPTERKRVRERHEACNSLRQFQPEEGAMKKLIGAVVVAASVAGLNVFACGGMTQIDPPSLQLNSNSVEAPVESVLEDLEENLVIC